MKPQGVRLIDVFVFGPIMIGLAMKKRALTNPEKIVLGFIGAGTVLYNWANYVEYRRKQLEN